MFKDHARVEKVPVDLRVVTACLRLNVLAPEGSGPRGVVRHRTPLCFKFWWCSLLVIFRVWQAQMVHIRGHPALACTAVRAKTLWRNVCSLPRRTNMVPSCPGLRPGQLGTIFWSVHSGLTSTIAPNRSPKTASLVPRKSGRQAICIPEYTTFKMINVGPGG